MPKHINEIIFSKDRYGNSREKMFEAVTKQLMLLMDNEYVCKVYDDDRDIIVIEFEHNNMRGDWGTPELCWLEPEELEAIENYRYSQNDDDAN